jgi:hypothetical protein
LLWVLQDETRLFPQDIIDKYTLYDKVDADGNVFCKVQCGMYGLPQAGIIAQDLLTKTFTKQVTARTLSHQDAGGTIGAPSASPLSLTILA